MDTVDSFAFLEKEIFSIFSSARDGFAILGGTYLATRFACSAMSVYKLVKIHGLSRCRRPDLVKKYGPWASKFITSRNSHRLKH